MGVFNKSCLIKNEFQDISLKLRLFNENYSMKKVAKLIATLKKLSS